MAKEYYLQTYDDKYNIVVLDNHSEIYEPYFLFSNCMYVAHKFHKQTGLGISCYCYDQDFKSFELIFDLQPEIAFLSMLKKLFEPHEV